MKTTIAIHIGAQGPAAGAGSDVEMFRTVHPDVVAAMLAAARTAVDALAVPAERNAHNQRLLQVERAAAQ